MLIRLTSSLNGVKSVKGLLRDVSEDSILVEGETEIQIPRDKIKAANLEGEI